MGKEGVENRDLKRAIRKKKKKSLESRINGDDTTTKGHHRPSNKRPLPREGEGAFLVEESGPKKVVTR